MPISLRKIPWLAIAACAAAALSCNFGAPGASASPTVASLPTAIPPSPTAQVTIAPSASPSPNQTATPMPTATASGPLTGTVVQRSNCRYGPGAFYLYRTGFLENAPIEVLGRTVDGGWALVQYAGTTNRCWINSKLITVSGDLMALPDSYADSSSLPFASNFGPAAILSVNGDALVTVEWAPIVLPPAALPGDNEVQYVIEVWTCVNGEPAFYSLGTNETEMTFEVDNACGVVSRANIVAQNKLGVSGVTAIPIP